MTRLALVNAQAPHLEYCIEFWGPQDKTEMDLGPGPEEPLKMLRGLKQLCYGDSLRELGLFSLEKGRLQEDLRAPSSA